MPSMTRHDAASAEVLVFTFKEGLLSAVAHDLKLKVTRFSIELDEGAARGEFDSSSLKVVTAMANGAEAPGALPGFARGEIEKNVLKDVLEARRYPVVKFETTRVSGDGVEGLLTLHGVSKPVQGALTSEATRWVAQFTLDQRLFGIKPYSALLGTLRVRPQIVVRVSVPRGSATGA